MAKYKIFEESRAYVRKLGLKKYSEWRQWIKTNAKPSDIPSNPHVVYAGKGWSCWADFLGSENKYGENHQFQTFKDARSYARSLMLKSENKWREWVRSGSKPSTIPSNPQRVYADKGWDGWKDFLQDDKVLIASFEEARIYVHKLQLSNSREFYSWARTELRPQNIPSNPSKTYKHQWKGWRDFLGLCEAALNFEDAKKYVQKLGLKSFREWLVWARSDRRPNNIPLRPNFAYESKGWVDWNDFLNINKYKPFKEAKIFVQKLGIKSYEEWLIWARSNNRPEDIPYM